jgi:hypothetical protein
MYCRRCDDTVSAIVPWRGWVWLKRLWWVGVAIVLALFPLLAADFCVMLPSSIAYVLAGGILHRLASEQPICGRCSLPLSRTSGGTAIRSRKP